jgi:flagellar L-ring protein precursor FlgH
MSLPMPAPEAAPISTSSLWRAGSRAFFKDQRAAHVGDLVTVLVNVADAAILNDATTAQHNGTETMGVPNFFGLEGNLTKIFSGSTASSLVSANSTTNANQQTGNGIINRNETITLRIAGEITQVLPKGNMVVSAKQEIEVNSELRTLSVTGVVRPQDIASDNTVQHDRLAEARITYGGRGQLTEIQTARWGQQLLDILLPF